MNFKELFSAEPYSITTCPICNHDLDFFKGKFEYQCDNHLNTNVDLIFDNLGKVQNFRITCKLKKFAFCADDLDNTVRFYKTENTNWIPLKCFNYNHLKIKDYGIDFLNNCLVFR